jgi:D-arginine dehydrogenase
MLDAAASRRHDHGMIEADILVLGGGVAGLSLAARIAAERRVVVIEAEEALGYHSSGRSVTFSHYGIGNDTVRGLTRYSRAFFLEPGHDGAALCNRASALFVATEEMRGPLEALTALMERFSASLERVGEAEMRALVPPLRTGAGAVVAGIADHDGLRLDADALLQACARMVRSRGGRIELGQRVTHIGYGQGKWELRSGSGAWRAPLLVNAAGAWADEVAAMAGVRPIGLVPKRRTIIVIDPPEGAEVRGWPFLKTAVDDFYMIPQGGKLLASPVDEVESPPCDARPEEYDVALAAAKVEQYTTLAVRRIGHSWAGLRSFVKDRVPTAGFAPDCPHFFWLAGQGGYGLQTAPAMAEAASALLEGRDWPAELAALGVAKGQIVPERLIG